MKRYKDCELKCIDGQSPDELLDVIEQVSISKGYGLKRYSTMGDNDTIGVYLKEDGFPFSRLVMSRFFLRRFNIYYKYSANARKRNLTYRLHYI